MKLATALESALIIAAGMSVVRAVIEERRMQRHRQPGVTYWQVTFRRDGAWKRSDLFTDEGLAHQRKAARYGATALGLMVIAFLAFLVQFFFFPKQLF